METSVVEQIQQKLQDKAFQYIKDTHPLLQSVPKDSWNLIFFKKNQIKRGDLEQNTFQILLNWLKENTFF